MGILSDILNCLGQIARPAAPATQTGFPTPQTDLPQSDLSAIQTVLSEHPGGFIRTVTAPTGKTVNVRERPGGAKVTALPVGTRVRAISGTTDQSGVEWTQIEYTATGWMMAKYLRG